MYARMGAYDDERPSSKPASPPPSKADCYVLQRYLPRPMLLDGLKASSDEMQADVKALAERYRVELPEGAFEEEDAARRWGRDAAESKWRGVRSAVTVTAALNEPRDPFAVLHRATEGLQEQIFSMVEERGWSEDFETHSDQLGHELSHASVKAQLAQPLAAYTAESFHRAVVAAQVKRPRGTVRTLLRPHGRWRERSRAERDEELRQLGPWGRPMFSFDQRQIFASQIFIHRGKFLRDFSKICDATPPPPLPRAIS